MRYVLSLGAGVNSSCLLLMIVDKKLPCDEVVFADTGAENPETYSYIDTFIRPFWLTNGLMFTCVAADLSLEQYCLTHHATPSRQHRWCTDKWKIRPIYKHVERPCTFYMGICWDEVHRVHDPHQAGFGKNLFNEYPLIDWRMTREDCAESIQLHHWPVPIKSGCFFCPFQSMRGWENLYRKHPDLYDRAIHVESSDKAFPKYTLTGNGVALDRLRLRFGHGDHKLDDFPAQETCDSGFCMV